MTDNVVPFNGLTRLDLPPERVLARAIEEGLKSAVVVGWTADGKTYFASSLADSAEIIYLFERAKHDLLKMEDDLQDRGMT